MPDHMVALLVRFLEQNSGKFSRRAKEKEFKNVTEPEIADIERHYDIIFNNNNLWTLNK